MTDQDWIALVMEAGAANAAIAELRDFPFRVEFRSACEQNTCGSYNRNWMCPPRVGDIHTLISRAKQFDRAVVYQTIGTLEDSYDYEGMVAAKEVHNGVSQRIQQQLAGLDVLHLSAGGCKVCERCAALDEEPCRYPALAIPSLEAYGTAVSELAAACGLKYINGTNTVTFFGAVLFRAV